MYFQRLKIGYEINGMMFEIKQNEKLKHEQIFYVQHDLWLHEFEQYDLRINESKKFLSGLFQMMKKREKKLKQNQRKRRKNHFGTDGIEKH